jgi:hypothetical protein
MARARGIFVLWFGVSLALAVAIGVAVIVRADRCQQAASRIIAEVFNSGTGELSAYVYATNAEYKFENGKIGEAWLMRMVDVPQSEPMWFVKPTKAKVVWRQ